VSLNPPGPEVEGSQCVPKSSELIFPDQVKGVGSRSVSAHASEALSPARLARLASDRLLSSVLVLDKSTADGVEGFGSEVSSPLTVTSRLGDTSRLGAADETGSSSGKSQGGSSATRSVSEDFDRFTGHFSLLPVCQSVTTPSLPIDLCSIQGFHTWDKSNSSASLVRTVVFSFFPNFFGFMVVLGAMLGLVLGPVVPRPLLGSPLDLDLGLPLGVSVVMILTDKWSS